MLLWYKCLLFRYRTVHLNSFGSNISQKDFVISWWKLKYFDSFKSDSTIGFLILKSFNLPPPPTNLCSSCHLTRSPLTTVFLFPWWIPYFAASFVNTGACPIAQLVKNPPAMRKTWVLSLGWEDSLEKGKAPVFWPGEFHGLQRIRYN